MVNRHTIIVAPLQLWLLASVWLRLVVVGIGLRWCGFPTVAGWVPARTRDIGQEDLPYAVHHADLIARAARRLPFQRRCLARSLTLHWWLRAEGVPSDLRIGVRKDGHDLAAHAWVVIGDTPIDEMAAVAPFTPLKPIGVRHTTSPIASLGRLMDPDGRVHQPTSAPCLQEG